MNTLNLNQTVECKDFETPVHEPIWYVKAVRGSIVTVMTEEGPSDDFAVEVVLFNAMTMQPVKVLNHVFVGHVEAIGDDDYCYIKSIDLANKVVAKIKERGIINLEHWVDVEQPQ